MSTDSNGNGRADKISKSNRTAAAVAFCKQIQAKGLLAGVYASESWFTNYLDFSQIKTYSIWVAKYGTNTGKAQIKPTTSVYDGWQFSSSYKISAISTNVDVSYFYKDFGNTGNTNTNNTSTNSSTNLFIVGKTYTLTVDVKVRASAGITSRWKKRSELSTDGKKNSLNQTNAVLKKGTKITVLKITKKSDKEYWAQIPSGWVALMYNGTKYIK
jgi:hypothetical protein